MKSRVYSEQRLVLICPGYNCEKFIDLWWNSIKVQNYSNWMVVAVNDNSTDSTLTKLLDYSFDDDRLRVVYNAENKYQLRNWYDVIHNNVIDFNGDRVGINDNDIIVFQDMDDWFGSKYVFEEIVKEYNHRDILFTTARNFQLSDYYEHDAELYTDREQLFEGPIHKFSLFTYRAELFRSIPAEFFKDIDTEEFYQVCGDYALTLPLAYMAGPEHHQHQFFNGQPCAIVYNNIRPECDDNKVTDEGVKEHDIIREKIYDFFVKNKWKLKLR